MATSSGALLSAEDLLSPRFADEHVELVAGVIRYMTPAGGAHGGVAATLLVELGLYLRTHPVGRCFTAETGFVLRRRPDTLRCPDVAFVIADRIASGIPRGFFEGAPDLAVEVLSPSNPRSEISAKTAEYLATGGRLVWVLDPATKTVMVHEADGSVRRLAEGDELNGGSLLPGFRCPVATLFEGLA